MRISHRRIRIIKFKTRAANDNGGSSISKKIPLEVQLEDGTSVEHVDVFARHLEGHGEWSNDEYS